MANAKLKFGGKETPLGAGITSVGRSSDNSVAFPEDSNISRYHAEIEWRDGDFYVIDLGSSNGTTVNGERVTSDKHLSDGDEIVFGGSSSVEFVFEKDKSQPSSAGGGIAGNSGSDEAETDDLDEKTENKTETEVAEETPPDKKSRAMLGVTGAAVGLAVVFVVAAGYYYYASTSAPQCEARATITQPETGELLKNSTDIEVDYENTECVSRAVFVLDDMIIASNENAPYQASIDPSEFPELADGLNHSLKIVLEDEEGNPIGQQDQVLLSFDTIATPTPTPDETEPKETQPKPPTIQEREISLIDTKKMAENLVKQFPGSFSYKFDRKFLQDVKKKTSEYSTEGYFARAQQYRDTINEAFVKEQNLDAPLGFLLAMSRSKFLPENTPTGAGLWEMPADFAAANGYDGTCEVKDLAEPTQRCAAIAAAAYMKNLALNIFEGDTVYSVASFGMSPQQASEWQSTLPANRADFWNLMKDKPGQREQVVNFFAAGIVAENPQKFGLKKEQPLSNLYRNLMAQ